MHQKEIRVPDSAIIPIFAGPAMSMQGRILLGKCRVFECPKFGWEYCHHTKHTFKFNWLGARSGRHGKHRKAVRGVTSMGA